MACIRKRNNNWVVDYRFAGGRRRQSFDTKAEAEAFKRSLLLRPIDKVTDFDEDNEITLGEAVEKYINQVLPTKAPRTQDSDRLTLKLFIEKYGSLPLEDVRLMELEAYQMHLSRTYVPASVNRHFNTIRHFFRKCEDWELIKQNPTRRLRNLKARSKEKRLWTREEFEKFYVSAPKWLQDIGLYIYETGIRRGEAVALLWKDVDFDKGAVRIKSIKGGIARERLIPMTQARREWFFKLKNQRPLNSKPNSHVFLGENEEPLDAIYVSTNVHRLVHRLGVDGLGLHGMRHTLLTELVQSDVSLEKVRQIAGHSNLKTTEQYLHIKLDDTRSVLELCEERRKILRPDFLRKTK